jgi:hypothetical protein
MKRGAIAEHQWLTSVNLATQEAEIGRVVIQNQQGQLVPETLFQKNPSQKRNGGVAQGVHPEFNFQYCKGRKKGVREGV